MSTGKTLHSPFESEVLSRAFGDRFRSAYSDLEKLNGGHRISQGEMGDRVAQKLGSGRSANAVSGWWTGKSIPDTPVMVALAEVLGVDPGWLEFGPELSSARREGHLTGAASPEDDDREIHDAGDDGLKESG